MYLPQFLLYRCGLFDLCAHDIVGLTIVEDEELTVVDNLLAIGYWRWAMGVLEVSRGIALALDIEREHPHHAFEFSAKRKAVVSNLLYSAW